MPLPSGFWSDVGLFTSGLKRVGRFQHPKLEGQIIAVRVDQQSPIPWDAARPNLVDVKSDVGQAVIEDRVVSFR